MGFLTLQLPANEISEDLISVIIPTRNRPTQLVRAVRSVFSQTHRPVEVIVVDDASSDPVENLLIQNFGPDIIYRRNEKTSGAAVSRNFGLQIARGEFVAFLDDDDTWQPTKLSDQLAVMKDGVATMCLVGCGFSYVLEGKEVALHSVVPGPDFNSKLLGQNLIGGCSVPLISMSALREAGGFDEDFPSCQDWDLWLRLAQVGEVGFVPVPLVSREIHGEQITSDVRRKITGREMLLSKFKQSIKTAPDAYGEHLRRLGTLWLLEGERFKARRYYLSALNFLGFDCRAIIGILISWVPIQVSQYVARKFATNKIGEVTFYH